VRSTGSPHQPGRNARRGQDKQEDRPRRLRGATRKSVTHSARSQVRDHFAARRRPAEKPDKLEARGRRGLEPMTGKMQVKKSWQQAAALATFCCAALVSQSGFQPYQGGFKLAMSPRSKCRRLSNSAAGRSNSSRVVVMAAPRRSCSRMARSATRTRDSLFCEASFWRALHLAVAERPVFPRRRRRD
jgi:hypothetical protein